MKRVDVQRNDIFNRLRELYEIYPNDDELQLQWECEHITLLEEFKLLDEALNIDVLHHRRVAKLLHVHSHLLASYLPLRAVEVGFLALTIRNGFTNGFTKHSRAIMILIVALHGLIATMDVRLEQVIEELEQKHRCYLEEF